MTNSSPPMRVNVLLPADVARALRDLVPPRQRARFIAEAVERELRRIQVEAALEASAGAWQDADHPELADGPAIDRWIAEGRARLEWDRAEGV
ncbi:MAG: hypothetical protein NZ528_04290 [Caldilineales bacterium]|nr:hypothetical protein [Caldilineales bacterium]